MPKTQVERLWLFAGAVAAVLVLLIGWFLLISPQRSSTSSVDGQLGSARQLNQQLQARINSLKSQNDNLAVYQAEYAKAQLALPDSSGLPDLLRTLQSIGNSTQTNVTALTVGAPTNLTAASTSVAKSTSPSSAATAPAAKPASTGAGVGTVYALPITATVNGTFGQLDEFLSQLQSVQPRAVLITQLTQGAAVSGGGPGDAAAGRTSLTLTMQAFVAPSDAAESAQLAAAAKAGK